MSAIRIDDDNGVERLAGEASYPDGLDLADGALTAGDTTLGALIVSGNVGFYGGPTVAKPSVTNATAGDILAALVTLGLVTDDT